MHEKRRHSENTRKDPKEAHDSDKNVKNTKDHREGENESHDKRWVIY